MRWRRRRPPSESNHVEVVEEDADVGEVASEEEDGWDPYSLLLLLQWSICSKIKRSDAVHAVAV